MEQDQLRAWEARCIQEEPPGCATACPIHVDARAFVRHMAAGDAEAAYKVLAKSMPFPGVLARICDHPCEAGCRRADIDDPIAIGMLERRCIEDTGGDVRVQLLPRRPQSIAVLGGGLTAMTVAWELRRKGFGITVFFPEDRLGGSLRSLDSTLLPPQAIADALSAIEALKTELAPGTPLDAALFERVRAEFDAVVIDRECVVGGILPLACDSSGSIAVEPADGATDVTGVFAGGGTVTRSSYSPVTEVFEGKRAALSVERFIQQAQMSAGRDTEGPYDTRLFTSVEGLTEVSRVEPSNPGEGYSKAEASAEAARCIQCECMECLKGCLYLERYDGYPKKYARQVFGNERVVLGAPRAKNQFIASCSTCGICGTVCPNGFDMGDLCVQARRTLNRMKAMPASFHEFALQDMSHSDSERFTLVRNEPGRETSAWAYFPSCHLSGSSPGEVFVSYEYLRGQLDGGVGIMLGCCGVPAYWAGRKDLFAESMRRLRESWELLGKPRIVTACPSCLKTFRDHLPEFEAVSIWEIVREKGAPAGGCPATGRRVAVVDPCATRDDPAARAGARAILGALGVVVSDLPGDSGQPECCGYGGLMYNANPALADAVIQRRLRAVTPEPTDRASTPPGWFRKENLPGSDTRYYATRSSEDDYVTYCAMCRDNFSKAGKRISHLIEQVFPATEDADPAARDWISWSDRRSNRERVRARVLEAFGETAEGVPVEPSEQMKIEMMPEVRRAVDSRRILEDDIRAVIAEAETTGRRLHSEDTGHVRAYRQLGHVTFWVEYTPEDDRFVVHNAYSHRMMIVGVKR